MGESHDILPDPKADTSSHSGTQEQSKWWDFIYFGLGIGIFFLLVAIGLPYSVVENSPRRLPGRFIMSPFRILFTLTILCGVVAAASAALGLLGQSVSSVWVAIAGSGIMAMLLFLLKEHRNTSPDFAPWLFETDYKTGCANTAFFIAHIVIAHKSSYIFLNGSGFSWRYISPLLILTACCGFVDLLWLSPSFSGREQPANLHLFVFTEEIAVFGPRWLFGFTDVTAASPVATWVASPVLGLVIQLVLRFVVEFYRHFRDNLSR